MSPDRATADRLSEHLDAVVNGDISESHGLDPATAATVERFFAADDAPGPPPGLAEQLWRELSARTILTESVPYIPATRPGSNGHVPPPPRQIAPPRSDSSMLAFFATAALIALTLVGGVLVSLGTVRFVRPDQQAAIIPAADHTPKLRVSVFSDDILVDAMLEEMPPAGGTHQLGLYRAQLAPGAEEQAGTQADTGVGFDLFTVESGQVTVEADAPILVTRGGTSPADVASPVEPGTAVVLGAGDQLDVPSGVSFRRRNDGPTQATLLGFTIGNVGESTHTWSSPAGVTYIHGLPFTLPSEFPAIPAEASVHRLTLAPGTELPVRDLPGLELVYVEAGALDLVYAKAEAPATAERAFTIRAGSGTDTFGRTPERAVLANRGTEALVILAASLIPASGDEVTPPPVWSDGWGSGDHAAE